MKNKFLFDDMLDPYDQDPKMMIDPDPDDFEVDPDAHTIPGRRNDD